MSGFRRLAIGSVVLLVRAALRVYPAEFRREAGPAMERDFRARAADRIEKGVPTFVVWVIASAGALLVTCLAEWRDRAGRVTVPSAADLRAMVRSLVRTPGWTLAAVATLGIAIGANTVIFSIVRSVLLAPLPYAAADRLVTVWSEWTDSPKTWVSAPEFVNYTRAAPSIEGAAAFFVTRVDLTEPGDPARIRVNGATPNALDVLGMSPVAGRMFTWAEAEAGEAVVLIGHDLWQRRFGGDLSAIGRTVVTGGIRNRIVGVLPPGFAFPQGYGRGEAIDLLYPYWVDLSVPAEVPRMGGDHGLMMVARLTRDGTVERVRAELNGIASRLEAQGVYPEEWRFGVLVNSASDEVVGPARAAIHLMWGAGLFVLLIACANVANLVLARSEERSGDVSVRSALGAGRTMLVKLVLTETGLIAAAGTVAGIAAAASSISVVAAFDPWDLPRISTIGMSRSILVYAVALGVLASLSIGVLPAMRVARAGNSPMRPAVTGSRVIRGQRVQGVLVVAQAVLAVVLLIGAGLMGRSVAWLSRIDPGFATRSGVTFGINLPEADYPDSESVRVFNDALLDRLRDLAGVRRAAAARVLPLAGMGTTGAWPVGGAVEGNVQVEFQIVSDQWFETMGIPVSSGRTFTRDDREQTDVLVINEAMARQVWPDGSAVGRRVITMGDTTTVIGIVANVAQNGILAEARPQAYRLLRQVPDSWIGAGRGLYVVVVTDVPSAQMMPLIRRELTGLASDIPLTEIRTVEELVAGSWARQRYIALFIGFASAVATLLAVVGLHGVLAYSVSVRAREIGVRMALGARSVSVVGAVVGRGLVLVGVGTLIGALAALGATRLLTTFLHGIQPHDPMTFGTAVAAFLVLGLIACGVPALRAARTDPIRSLRSE